MDTSARHCRGCQGWWGGRARAGNIWGDTRIVAISASTGEARTRFATDRARLFCHDLSEDGRRLLIERYVDSGERHLGMLDLPEGAIAWLLREPGVHLNWLTAVAAPAGTDFIASRPCPARPRSFRRW